MFSPEKILGSLLKDGFSSGSKSKSRKSKNLLGGAGLGVVAGVALAAAEHFMERRNQAPPTPPGPQPLPGGRVAPPPPPGATPAGPPPPPGVSSPPPVPPGRASGPSPPTEQTSSRAVALIRAMIGAAQADGVLDREEKRQILDRLVDADPDDQAFLMAELNRPQDMEAILAAVDSPEMAQEVYAVSLLAIEVDTEAEQVYLQKLARRLNLDPTVVANLHAQAGAPAPLA